MGNCPTRLRRRGSSPIGLGPSPYFAGPHVTRHGKTALLEGGALFSILALRIASGTSANLSFLALAMYALVGRTQALRALALAWLIGLLNGRLVPDASFAAGGRYVVFIAAASSVLVRQSRLPPIALRLGLALLTTGAFLIVHSLLVSPYPDVSILKAVSWTVVALTVVLGWAGLNVHERDALGWQIFFGLALVMLASLPLLASPIGYQLNGEGFEGILSHPQVFGPTMALLCAWAMSRLLGQPRPNWAYAIVAACSLMLTFRSGSRTAGLAMVSGVTVAFIVALALSTWSAHAVVPGLRSGRVHAAAAATLLTLLLGGGAFVGDAETFIAKGTESRSVADAYKASRGGLVDEMWANIEENPFLGIGFGIASEPGLMVVTRDTATGLPLSAPVEKGVLPVATLEEVGLLGSVLVAVALALLVIQSSKGGVESFAVALTALFLNMGESTFFSPSGLGLLPLILLGWAFSCGLPGQQST